MDNASRDFQVFAEILVPGNLFATWYWCSSFSFWIRLVTSAIKIGLARTWHLLSLLKFLKSQIALKNVDKKSAMVHNSGGGKMLEYIAKEVPLFKSIEKKQQFVEVMGALSLRLISLAKAAELMEMEKDQFLNIIENYGYEFSFLDKSDIEIERENH